MNRLVPAPGVSFTCQKPENTLISLYPVILSRAAGNQFYAVSSRCPHEDCAVSKLSPASASGNLTCSGHGSRFWIDGSFISGPANGPLDFYEVNFDGADTLRIQLPEIFFELSTVGVVPGDARKLAINFLASTNVTYEVRYQQTLEASSVVVPFSTTPDGAVTNSLGGIDDYVTVFVERQTPTGFYSVAMKILEV
jgi:nitrite reductase/ring-hydroxylating ferredoxin subunit